MAFDASEPATKRAHAEATSGSGQEVTVRSALKIMEPAVAKVKKKVFKARVRSADG